MRKILFTFTVIALALSAATLAAQQNLVMVQVLDGYTGVAIARHRVNLSIGATPVDAKARKSTMTYYTDARGVLMLPLPAGSTSWIQLWTTDMHTCELHPEADAFSLAKVATTGVQAPNICSKLSTKISSGHFVIYMREFTTAERAALKSDPSH